LSRKDKTLETGVEIDGSLNLEQGNTVDKNLKLGQG
jgi:hypothetical protein